MHTSNRSTRPTGPSALRATALLAVIVLLSCGRDAEPPASRPPEAASLSGAAAGWNVVLISIDTLRADRLGAYGYDQRNNSPRIDALVASGTRVEQAHAPRALTWPSLASVLTGLYPSGHGLIYNGYELEDAETTLPKLLQEAGYATGAFLSNMCSANHQGWEEIYCAGGVDRRVVRRALDWLGSRSGTEGAESSKPVFLWTHFFGPHPPYYNGGERALTLDPGYSGTLAPRKGVLDRVMTESIELDPADRDHLDALYDAAVMGTDDHVGALLSGLWQSLDPDRTLVVFLADHGEDLYQHNRYLYHACSVYQSSLRVPLAFVAPSLIPAGGRLSSHAELVDVLPTLLELLGLPSPGCLHGESLVDRLGQAAPGDGEVAPTGTALSEYGATAIHTVIEDRFKLISNPEGVTPVCMQDAPEDLYPIGELELYDLVEDPDETHDLAAERPEIVERLQQRLGTLKADLCSRTTTPVRTQQITDEMRRQLEELGYVVEQPEG